MKKEEVDVLVIGAGPSGCVASAYLYNHGVKVKVVEKSRFPRFVIGESFLPRSMEHYEEAGLLEALKAKNFEIKPGARFIREKKYVFLISVISLERAGTGPGRRRGQILIIPWLRR